MRRRGLSPNRRNSGPNPAPIRREGQGLCPSRDRGTQRPTGGHAGLSHSRRSFATRWRSVAKLQFLQLAVVILVYHLLDRPEGEQQIAVAPTAGLGDHLGGFCGDESSLLQLADVLADGILAHPHCLPMVLMLGQH